MDTDKIKTGMEDKSFDELFLLIRQASGPVAYVAGEVILDRFRRKISIDKLLEIRSLINPDRRGGVSGFELKKASLLLESLMNDLAVPDLEEYRPGAIAEAIQEVVKNGGNLIPMAGPRSMRDGDHRPELAPFLLPCTCNRSDIGVDCVCFHCGGIKKE